MPNHKRASGRYWSAALDRDYFGFTLSSARPRNAENLRADRGCGCPVDWQVPLRARSMNRQQVKRVRADRRSALD